MEYPSLELEAVTLLKDHPEIFAKSDEKTISIIMAAFDLYSKKAIEYINYLTEKIIKDES